MLKLIDVQTGLHVGGAYSDEEAAAVVFAVNLYRGLVLRDATEPLTLDVAGVLEGIELLDILTSKLEAGQREITSEVDRAIATTALRALHKLSSNCPANQYTSVSEALGVQPAELLGHAITASQILASNDEAPVWGE